MGTDGTIIRQKTLKSLGLTHLLAQIVMSDHPILAEYISNVNVTLDTRSSGPNPMKVTELFDACSTALGFQPNQGGAGASGAEPSADAQKKNEELLKQAVSALSGAFGATGDTTPKPNPTVTWADLPSTKDASTTDSTTLDLKSSGEDMEKPKDDNENKDEDENKKEEEGTEVGLLGGLSGLKTQSRYSVPNRGRLDKYYFASN